MTPDQTRFVRHSYAAVAKRKSEAGRIFYAHLFAIAPELRPMFKSDMEAQANKFIETLGVIFELLHNPAEFSYSVKQLAHRHRGYGVRDEHFNPAGVALQATLEDVLGETFTPELRDAWSALYAMVASAMKRASPAAP
jgi:nitric oxide dioxygenase